MKNFGIVIALIFASFFVVLGLVGFVNSINHILDVQEFNANSSSTVGKVVDMREESDSEDGYDYYAVISYTTQSGQHFQSVAKNSTSNSPEVGSTTSVLYQTNKPQIIYTDKPALPWWEPLLNLVFLVFGIGIGWATIVNYSNQRWLLRHGHTIQANYVKVQEVGDDPTSYRIICEGFNPFTRQSQTFRSSLLKRDPSRFLNYGAVLKVLIDPKNPKRYLLQTDFK